MRKPDTLRLRDVRAAYRLIGECRDLGDDPALWHRHMLAGLRRLLPATHVSGGEGRWRPTIRALSAFDDTDDTAIHAAFKAYHRAHGPADDPFFRSLLARLSGRLITRTRRQLVADADWCRSHTYQAFKRPVRITDEMTSLMTTSTDGSFSIIALNRTAGDPDFSAREQRLFNFFHGELGRLVRGALASATEASPDTLSTRLRQTLRCIVEGDSEKQIAARLGLSATTVHQYVTVLYRRFGVRSRAQLLAYALKRARRDGWRSFLATP